MSIVETGFILLAAFLLFGPKDMWTFWTRFQNWLNDCKKTIAGIQKKLSDE